MNRARLPLQAGEVLETIQEFASMKDPRDDVLMDRTLVICNVLSMPLESREASTYMPKALSLSCVRCCHVEERVSEVQVDIG